MGATSRADVLVLGAGPTGLAAAHELAQAGTRVEVIEAGPEPGGLCRTLRWGDLRFDIGGHRFFTQRADVAALVESVAGDELIEVRRQSRILLGGRFLPMPPGLLATARAFPGVAAGAALHALGRVRGHRERTAPDLESYLLDRFGRQLYGLVFEGYTRKVWGIPPSAISADWGPARIEGLRLAAFLTRALGFGGRGPRDLRHFRYPRDGYGRIFVRMAEALARAGGAVRTGSEVCAVRREGDHIEVHGSDGRCWAAERVLSTLPIAVLAELLGPDLDSRALTAARALRYRALRVLVLRLAGDATVSPDTWLYFPDPAIPFCRLHEPGNWSPALVPAGARSLVIEYFCDEGDALWSRPEAELARDAVAVLAGLELLDPGRVQAARALGFPRAYPVYELGYRASLDALLAALDRVGGLSCAGRAGAFRYLSSDECIHEGLLAGRRLLTAAGSRSR